MNKNYNYELVELSEIEELRNMKLNDYKSQISDYIEEGSVTYKAQNIVIRENNDKIGYFCIGTQGEFEGKILEFFLMDSYKKEASYILQQARDLYYWSGWFVNSQDSFSMPLLLDLNYKYSVNGYIFAYNSNENNKDIVLDDKLALAEVSEVREIYDLIMLDNFYTGGNEDSLLRRIKDKEVYLLRRDGKLIGVGFISILRRTPQYADLAMIIAPDERRKGYGEYLQRAMVRECFYMKIIPTACCDVNNIRSRQTLEKAGFYMDGCLLSVQFDQR